LKNSNADLRESSAEQHTGTQGQAETVLLLRFWWGPADWEVPVLVYVRSLKCTARMLQRQSTPADHRKALGTGLKNSGSLQAHGDIRAAHKKSSETARGAMEMEARGKNEPNWTPYF
jgi:hypothetical protein